MSSNRSPRYPLQFQVVYDDGQSFMSGPVRDVSESGIFIETVMPLDPGTKVRITPLLPGPSGIFELDGIVMRKSDYDLDNTFDKVPGMGVRFENVGETTIEALRELFKKATWHKP
jgi:hypothetical protein